MCDSPFSPENMSYDIIVKDEKKKYVCMHLYCGKVFNYESEMKRHITIHSPARPFKCPYDNCIKSFKRSDALDNHIRCSHKKEANYVCPFPGCEMAFAAHGSFRHHVQKNHQKVSEEIYDPEESSSAQITKKVKLESEKEKPVYINLSGKKIDSNNQSEVNFETDTSGSASETNRTEKMNQIAEENKILKENLKNNEKAIKCMQEKINDLLGRFYTFQAEIETKTEKPTFQILPEPKDSFFEEDNFEECNSKRGNLSEFDCDAFPNFGDAFEFEKNYY